MSKVKLNLKPLHGLQKKLAEVSTLRARVGVFEDSDHRTPSQPYHTETSNATLGAIHEFGEFSSSYLFNKLVHVPERSFLRMPLILRWGDELRRHAAGLGFQLLAGSAKQFLNLVGRLGHSVVDEAFATRRYGSWKELAQITKELKQSDVPLIETGQLRDSIRVKVV